MLAAMAATAVKPPYRIARQMKPSGHCTREITSIEMSRAIGHHAAVATAPGCGFQLAGACSGGTYMRAMLARIETVTPVRKPVSAQPLPLVGSVFWGSK